MAAFAKTLQLPRQPPVPQTGCTSFADHRVEMLRTIIDHYPLACSPGPTHTCTGGHYLYPHYQAAGILLVMQHELWCLHVAEAMCDL